MRRSGRAQLRARLRSLAWVEAANVVIVPGAALLVARSWDLLTPAVVLGAVAVGVALAAGSAYWFRRIDGPVGLRWCRACEAGLAAAGVLAALALVWSVLGAARTGPGAAVLGVVLALFAAAEVVNYRFVQISAGAWLGWFHGRIRRPHLALDLRRAARHP